MKQTKLQFTFLVLALLFVIHGLEEYFTEFYSIDWSYRSLFGSLSDIPQVFLLYQLGLWLLLLLTFLLLKRGKRITWLLMAWGVISILELQHVYAALTQGSYYPGLITSLLFPVVAVYYWRELFRNPKH